MRVHRLEQIVQCPLMHSPIGLLHCRRHLFKSISQWHLFPALIGRELFSSPALQFSAFKCIDPRADTIICSDFHVRVTLRVEGYGVRRTNMLRLFFEVKRIWEGKDEIGRICASRRTPAWWIDPGERSISRRLYGNARRKRRKHENTDANYPLLVMGWLCWS